MTLSSEIPNGALKISGSLDITEASLLRDALLESLTRQLDVSPGWVDLDLGEVESCDAAALQVLLAARKGHDTGKKLRFVALSPALTDAAAALGLKICADSPLIEATDVAT